MNKSEFLDQLRQSLNGRLEAEQVADNLRYYEEYINSQLRLGRTENEIMTALGSPRLIARTITDAKEEEAQEAPYEEYEREQENGWDAGRWQGSVSWLAKFLSMPKWLKMILGFGALFLVAVLFFWILKFLFPVIVIAMLTVFLVKLFRDWLN